MLNNHRKAIGLELTDRIHVRLRCGGPALAAARQHQAWIAEEVLAVSFEVRNGEERVEPPDWTRYEVEGMVVFAQAEVA